MKRPLPTIVNFTKNKLTEAQKSLGFYDIPADYIEQYEAKYHREVMQRKSLKEILAYIHDTKNEARKHLGLAQLINLAGTVEAMAILFDEPNDIFLEIETIFGYRQVHLFNDIKVATRWIKEETALPYITINHRHKSKIFLTEQATQHTILVRIDSFFDPDSFSDIADVF